MQIYSLKTSMIFKSLLFGARAGNLLRSAERVVEWHSSPHSTQPGHYLLYSAALHLPTNWCPCCGDTRAAPRLAGPHQSVQNWPCRPAPPAQADSVLQPGAQLQSVQPRLTAAGINQMPTNRSGKGQLGEQLSQNSQRCKNQSAHI